MILTLAVLFNVIIGANGSALIAMSESVKNQFPSE
jgi:hypothetical protein